ncbi:histidine kinase dimerization/phosphoacceptor domain -containing protein [Gracilimonas mengyeensis]|uniref:histidine kinase n=1 Tax=Gracilimonas mengyeensis TaxID=1302730 RepID=A0A521FIS8_9BACT|nr:histidine kinase dimerization/phosphoacceptor domain -containing protein [Gracilimonas mengyeensis]SMO96107.1 Two-component sensor histidine kinase, contains HisKA and HATPase domains [Gracilimonas mengyeensis]
MDFGWINSIINRSIKKRVTRITKNDVNITHHFPGTSRSKDLLLRVVEGINRTFELKELLVKSMEAAKLVMHAEASSLMLLDETTGELNVSIPTGPVKEEIIGKTIPRDRGIGGWVIRHNKPFVSNDISDTEVFWKDLSNGFTTRNILCVPLKDDEGEAFGVLQVLNKKKGLVFTQNDIFIFELLALHVSNAIQRSKKYDALANKLEDCELQLSEIHHRLKNNLATICALLELDIAEIDDEVSQEALAAANTRLKSVAEAHTLLYNQQDAGQIELSSYLEAVLRNIENVFYNSEKEISITTRFEALKIDANRGMLCGLIVNELLINAYKHAFVGQSSGEVVITLKLSSSGKVIFMISDNGVGFDQNKGSDRDNGGHFIVEALAQKLKADINFATNPNIGSTCIVSFPFEM